MYNGFYYTRKIAAEPYESNDSFSDGTTIISGKAYWFKCEPIEWKIISSTNNTYSLFSSKILDAHRYNESYFGIENGYYANNYKNSEIRLWLNDEFYNTAFGFDSSKIITTTVDNSASTTDSATNKCVCENTNDKVYLISYQDARNESYYLSDDELNDDELKSCATDYAKANGLKCYDDHYYSYWTRSPAFNDYYDPLVFIAFSTGGVTVSLQDGWVNDSFKGVCPAITIKI